MCISYAGILELLCHAMVENGTSWFVAIQQILLLYDLQLSIELPFNQMKNVWKTLVNILEKLFNSFKSDIQQITLFVEATSQGEVINCYP